VELADTIDSHSISIKTLPISGMYVNSIVFNKQYYTIGYTILFYRNFNKKGYYSAINSGQ